MICASPEYLDQHGAPQSLDELSCHAQVRCSADGAGLEGAPGRLARTGAAAQMRSTSTSTSTLRCTTQSGAIEAAIGGAGLLYCLRHQVIDALDAGHLLPVLEAFEPAPLTVHLVYREGRKASARVRCFVDFAGERLGTHPAFTS